VPPVRHLVVSLVVLLAPVARALPVTIVGTNDLHGQVERVAALVGHVEILRAQAAEKGGGVLLLDAGDMFQGTLESNLQEGKAVIVAYNHAGYDAVCIGNHEFDFGPVGPDVIVKAKDTKGDPRGALKARAKEANFPLLAANIFTTQNRPVGWPNVRPSTIVTVKGKTPIKVGLIGLATVETPRTTIKSNVKDLRFMPLKDTILREASLLRQRGTRAVIVIAHAGGRCAEDKDVHDAGACESDGEIVELARALPAGAVDAIIAGHTHQTMAHVINGVPIIESWANGRGFGRIDLDIDDSDATKPATLVKVHPPRRLCGDDKSKDTAPIESCTPAPYEGKTPVIDQALLNAAAPFFADAKARRAEPLGVTIEKEVAVGYDKESALGNLFVDLLRAPAPGEPAAIVDVALMNGGAIRASLPQGPLTYGHVFEMMPFDNRKAFATMTGKELRTLLERNLNGKRKGGVYSTSGLRARITCADDGSAGVVLARDDDTPINDDDKLTVVTSDFVAMGGDDGLGIDEARVQFDEGEPLREHLVAGLKASGGSLNGDDARFFDPLRPRLHRPGSKTARCAPAASAPETTTPAKPAGSR